LLHDNGYATGHFGKWHIGPQKRNPPEGIYGFDEVKIIGRSKSPDAGRDDDLFDAAIDFIKRHRDRPFYVNIWGHITHYPVKPDNGAAEPLRGLHVDESRFDPYMAKKFANTRGRGFDVDTCMRSYLADVYALDLAVGRLLQALDDWNLDENTIVVFSSDQGPAPNGKFQNQGQRENDPVYKANMLGWAGGLRGGKHEQYEGGVRIPFILRWPGRVPANRVNATSVLSGLDWLPTLCALTATPYKPSQFEGLDVSDIWLGHDRNPERYLFWKAGGSPSALCDPWKIHLTRTGAELYNLAEDPGETTNVAERYPEMTKQMTTRTSEWTQTLPATVRREPPDGE
jgi:N-acetylgalactosamine-6-sulfatase